MKVKCPHCGAVAQAVGYFAGKSVVCPKCKKSHVAKRYDRAVVLANKAKSRDAAKKGRPPPEPQGPIVLPIVGVLVIILGAMSIPVAGGAGAIGVVGGIVLIALGNIQEHVQKTAYWAKWIYRELREQNESEKK